MIKIDSRFDPLLKRPFSVYRTKSDQFEIVYQIVGRGTEILSTKSPGENLQILGPIGNGFTIPLVAKKIYNELATPKMILVGGGVGIASLMLLAIELRKKEIDVTALIGATNQNRLIGVDDFAEIGAKVIVSTEDGSYGHQGLAPELLEKELQIENEKTRHASTRNTQHATIMYACGPYGMLKNVAKIALADDIPAQLSFESRMACGLGACLGCVIKVRSFALLKDDIAPDGGFEYKRVCKDGPVFNAQEVMFDD